MNQYPLWKNILVLVIVVIGTVFALPNLYDDDFAIQISSGGHDKIGLDLMAQVEIVLNDQKIAYKQVKLSDDILLISFFDVDMQLKAKEAFDNKIEDGYIIALNLASTTPKWLDMIGGEPMNLGLDLRGGVYFLIDVDMDAVVTKSLDTYSSELRAFLRDEKIRYQGIRIVNDSLMINLRSADDLNRVLSTAKGQFSELVMDVVKDSTVPTIIVKLTEVIFQKIRLLALEQNIITLRNRIDELGVTEPIVQRQGDYRIVIQLPGMQDTARAKKILSATATLEFRLVHYNYDVQDVINGRVPAVVAGGRLFHHRDGRQFLLNKRVILTGEHIINAASTLDHQSGSPSVSITLDSKGARKFSNSTFDNIGNAMAVVFIKSKTEMHEINGEIIKIRRQVPEIISVAVIRDQLSKKFQITGLDSMAEAYELALLLRAGSLAVPIEIVEERTVGPSLGQDNIDQGLKSIMLGFILVLIFMAIWYKVFGVVANLALVANLVLIVALLSMLQATLTMPGIAGIVLTVGMAVDANILIFERIREELSAGNTTQVCISSGYSKAFSTIADANVTTLIAAIVLFSFGTGLVKGFAVTLSLGILTSMFTAIMGTRVVINLIYGHKHRPKLSI